MMRDKITVSICCLTYNHQPYIRQCLDGFLMQECDFKYEVLIHDDASTDGTQDIIKAYALRYPQIIKPILRETNLFSQGIRGITVKYNYPRAKGKYIALCEGDDYWTDPLKLQKQVDFLEQNTDYVLTSHKREVVDEHDNLIPDIYMSDGYHTQCQLFRNVLKNDYLNYDAPITNGDTFLLYYLENFGKFKILDFVGARYRITQSGIWAGVDKAKQTKELIKSFKQMLIFFKKYHYKTSYARVKDKLLYRELKHILSTKESNFNKYNALFAYSVKYKNLNGIKNIIKLIFKPH